jgi:hypothetical protein
MNIGEYRITPMNTQTSAKSQKVRENHPEMAARGLSPRYLQRDRFYGPKIPYIKLGRMVLYDLAQVDAVLDAGRVEVKR